MAEHDIEWTAEAVRGATQRLQVIVEAMDRLRRDVVALRAMAFAVECRISGDCFTMSVELPGLSAALSAPDAPGHETPPDPAEDLAMSDAVAPGDSGGGDVSSAPAPDLDPIAERHGPLSKQEKGNIRGMLKSGCDCETIAFVLGRPEQRIARLLDRYQRKLASGRSCRIFPEGSEMSRLVQEAAQPDPTPPPGVLPPGTTWSRDPDHRNDPDLSIEDCADPEPVPQPDPELKPDTYVTGPFSDDEKQIIHLALAEGEGDEEIAARLGRALGPVRRMVGLQRQVLARRAAEDPAPEAPAVLDAEPDPAPEPEPADAEVIARRLDALPPNTFWTPERDHRLVFHMARGDGPGTTAAILRVQRHKLLARWAVLNKNAGDVAYQAVLLDVLEARAGLAREEVQT
jgi:hypothetical protein